MIDHTDAVEQNMKSTDRLIYGQTYLNLNGSQRSEKDAFDQCPQGQRDKKCKIGEDLSCC